MKQTMKNHVRYLFTLLALLVLCIGGVKAAEKKITIKYNSTFTPSLPTSGGNSLLTSHSVEGLSIEEQYIYKGNNSAYLMFVQNKGYLYNTENLGTIKSVSVTYSSGCSTAAQAGVYFGSTELSSYTTTSNQTIKGQSQTDTWTNAEANYGFFQLSTSNKNCQITQIDIIYDDGGLPLPEITFDDEVIKIELGKSIKNSISSNATNLTYHFSSDNTNVATVDEQGFVKGIGIGLATITVSWDAVENMYLEGSADFSVAVYPKGSDIFLASDIVTANTENSYYDFSNINIFTDAIYAGNAAKSSSGKIQMRSNNNNSGIVSTTSGGVIKQVIVGWGENSSARTLDVYGSNTLYSDASDLYDSEKRGTKLGSLTSSPVTTTLDIEDTYDYVGLRSNNNTLYLDYIIFVWDKANTITPTVNDERWGTANITGNIITAIPANGYRVSITNPYEVTPANAATVTQNGNEFTVIATADCTMKINFEAIPTHTVTYSVNGTKSTATFAEGENITFNTPADVNGKPFVGWITTTIDGTTNTAPAFVTSATMGTADVTYYAVYANVTPGTATYVTDVLTAADLAATNTTYTNFSGVNKNSVAVYAGQSAKTSNGGIQLRSKNSDSGIVSTTSGGIVKSVSIVVESGSNIVEVYGSNTAYENVSELYATGDNSNQGTKVGSLSETGTVSFSDDYAYVGLRSNNGAIYLTSVSITWENGTPDTYSGYCTTVVAPVVPAAPIVFHDGDATYEGTLTVPMFAEEGATIKYTVNGGDEQTYSTPVELSTGETTITAWAELNGVASDVVEKTFTIIEKAKGPSVTEKYYTISNNDKYVNVAGRRTVTFVGESATTTAAGTVIKVKATDGEVEVLRSQAVDIPGYAQRAMVYVPKVVRLVAEKLGAEGEGNLLGANGLDALMDKFNKSFDYTLHLESAGENAYRIYGRTPSMQPVVEFYAEKKANVDEKVKGLEQFINSAIEKILTKTGGRGTSILRPNPDQPAFSLVTVWEKMVVKTPNLTKPEDEASTAKFYEELLSSETNVWNFAYETAMIYWSRLKNNETFLSKKESLGEYAKYIDKIEYIRPNVKYYLVLNEGELDVFSQDNPLLEGTSEWTLDERTEFKVTVPADNELNGKFYTTFYADFAYTVPDGLKAYTIKEVKEGYCYDYAVKEEISGVIPAQTPVLLEADAAGEQTLTLKPEDTSAAIENELKGPDYLIEAGQIKAAQVENLFDMALGILGQEGYDNYLKEYEYLMLRTSGTVNNKYFFGLSKDDCKDVEENVCVLDGTSFNTGWKNSTGALYENKAFLVHESQTMIQLSMAGDVNRDGNVDNEDVNALVNIILGKVTEDDNYDMKAADVNCDGNEDITIADVTALVNIILGGSQN